MAFPNISDILATTIESRSRKIADNVTNNNAILQRLSQRGKIRTFSGGHKILQELSFAENSNAGWYSGYDLLPVGISDVISAAEFDIKQAAVPVVISGLEQLKNAGKERMIDLMEARLNVAESTLSNLITSGLYSDGTGATLKEIDGLAAAISLTPELDTTYGGISGVDYAFWRNKVRNTGAIDATAIQGEMNALWAELVRGQDRPDLIMADNTAWTTYVASLQDQQRFSNTDSADAGFVTVKFMDADVVLDGGMYGPFDPPSGGDVSGGAGAPAGTMYFLNSDYIHYRPHSARNMVPLSPNRRYATNQDAEVQIIGWAGNLTCSGRKFQGILDLNA
jgi:hypothetical protein